MEHKLWGALGAGGQWRGTYRRVPVVPYLPGPGHLCVICIRRIYRRKDHDMVAPGRVPMTSLVHTSLQEDLTRMGYPSFPDATGHNLMVRFERFNTGIKNV